MYVFLAVHMYLSYKMVISPVSFVLVPIGSVVSSVALEDDEESSAFE